MNSSGVSAEIFEQYTEWMTQRYPLLQVATILGEKKSIIYSFNPIGGEFLGALSFKDDRTHKLLFARFKV